MTPQPTDASLMICTRPLWSEDFLHYPDSGHLVREKRSFRDENVSVGLEARQFVPNAGGKECIVNHRGKKHKSHYIG